MNPRRSFFRSILGAGAGAAALARAARAQQAPSTAPVAMPPPNSGYPVPVLTPNIADLPFTIDNGVKVFHFWSRNQ